MTRHDLHLQSKKNTSSSLFSLIFGALQNSTNSSMATTPCLLCISVQDLLRSPFRHTRPAPCYVSTTRRRSTTQRDPPATRLNTHKPRTHSAPLCTTKRSTSCRGEANFRASKGLSRVQTREKNKEGSGSTSYVKNSLNRQWRATRCARNSDTPLPHPP